MYTYKSAKEFCDIAKQEYEYEIERISKLDNKISITLGFCGGAFLFLLGYINIRSLWNFNTQLMCVECILRFICTLLQIGCLSFFIVSIILLFKILRPRIYFRFDPNYLLKEETYELDNNQANMFIGVKYSEYAIYNSEINDIRSNEYSNSLKWLLAAIILCFVNEIIKKNFI